MLARGEAPVRSRPHPLFHRGAGLAVDFATADGFALVVRLLALDERERHFHPALLHVHAQRNQRQPFFGDASGELQDFMAVQQQLGLRVQATALQMTRVAATIALKI